VSFDLLFRSCCKLVRAKFHYTSWFGASSELVPNMFGASSELASVMEFGFKCHVTPAILTRDFDARQNRRCHMALTAHTVERNANHSSMLIIIIFMQTTVDFSPFTHPTSTQAFLVYKSCYYHGTVQLLSD